MDDFLEHSIAMKTLKARNMLDSLQVILYPHQKDKEQRKAHRRLVQRAYPESFKKKILKLDEVEL